MHELHGSGEREPLEAVIYTAVVVPGGVVEQDVLLLGEGAEGSGSHDGAACGAFEAEFEAKANTGIAVTVAASRTGFR
jgi:hypothetical protein